MNINEQNQSRLAECIRLAAKELMWASKNLACFYEAIRTEENPPMEDPNQLKLFGEEEQQQER